MKAIIKDLVHAVYMIGGKVNDGEKEYLDWIIAYSANVVIKRDDEFYEVPVKLRTELAWEENAELKLLETMDQAWKQFEEQCEKITANWKLVEEELEGTHGKIIAQRKIEL